MTRPTLARAAVAATLALGLGAALAPAATLAEPGARLFDRLDADGNGGVTRAELETAAAARFDALDADRDGRVSRAEMSTALETRDDRREARAEKRAGKILARADANGDGALSAAEFDAATERMRRFRKGPGFAALDADSNGRLTERELAEAMGGRGDRAMKRFEQADADRNGFVTRAEFASSGMLARLDRLVERADENGDGAISRDEAQAFARKGAGRGMKDD